MSVQKWLLREGYTGYTQEIGALIYLTFRKPLSCTFPKKKKKKRFAVVFFIFFDFGEDPPDGMKSTIWEDYSKHRSNDVSWGSWVQVGG